jgi:dihydrofolate synthase/folylpolyglutamate synthase
MKLGLAAMEAAAARAGVRWSASKYVHIAGTNGKGSTAAMVAAGAAAAGFRTGLYTSPHLARFAERIRIDGAPISDDALAVALNRALAENLTFFETATLAALLAFEAAGCDFVVLEVGLGGRLDATNIVPGERLLATAITSIGLDHQQWLGDTRAAIAREKAGILKKGVPCILGPSLSEAAGARGAEAREAIARCAAEVGATLVDACGAGPATNTDFWSENRATARALLAVGGLHGATIEAALANATWPGRFETITAGNGHFSGPWLLDGAHNEDGVRALTATLLARAVRPSAVVFGAMGDKNFHEVCIHLRAALPGCPFVFVAPRALGIATGSAGTGSLPARAAADPIELARQFGGIAAPSLEDALTEARRQAPEGLVLVTGSLYLVGASRALLLGEATDPPIAL